MNDTPLSVSEIVEMAWCDKTSFEDIYKISGLTEPQTIAIMRAHLKPSSFRLWRTRVAGRASKHKKMKEHEYERAGCLV